VVQRTIKGGKLKTLIQRKKIAIFFETIKTVAITRGKRSTGPEGETPASGKPEEVAKEDNVYRGEAKRK